MGLNDEGTRQAIEADDEAPLIEAGSVPVFYSDGAASISIEGENVRICYFEFRTLGGARIKSPVLEMVRPLRRCGNGDLKRLLDRKIRECRRKAH